MSYLKGLGNSVQSQGGFKKWPISGVDPLVEADDESSCSPARVVGSAMTPTGRGVNDRRLPAKHSRQRRG